MKTSRDEQKEQDIKIECRHGTSFQMEVVQYGTEFQTRKCDADNFF